MAKKKTVFVVHGRTESGDEFVYVLDEDAPREQIDAIVADDMPEEYEEVGFTNWSKTELCITKVAAITPHMVAEMHRMVAKSERND